MIAGLMHVLRAKGFDGASLNELSEAAGLKKASLYHRFPGGKKQMADAVLDFVDQWVEQHIYDVLADNQKPAEVRLKTTVNNIRALYEEGDAICLLRALSMETGMALFGNKIAASMRKWINAFTQLGMDKGLSEEQAIAYAQKTLIEVQGSLVVAKGMSDNRFFDTTLTTIEQHYLKL